MFKARLMGVYAIRNKVTGRVYVGASIDVEGRLKSHKGALSRRTHPVQEMIIDCIKHGEDSFEFEILEIVEEKEKLGDCEMKWSVEIGSERELYNRLIRRYPGKRVSTPASDGVQKAVDLLIESLDLDVSDGTTVLLQHSVGYASLLERKNRIPNKITFIVNLTRHDDSIIPEQYEHNQDEEDN